MNPAKSTNHSLLVLPCLCPFKHATNVFSFLGFSFDMFACFNPPALEVKNSQRLIMQSTLPYCSTPLASMQFIPSIPPTIC